MSKMKKCKVCDADISKSAEVCPKCGAVLKRKAGCGTKIAVFIAIVIGLVWSVSRFTAFMDRMVEVADAEKPISTITLADLDNSFSFASGMTDLQKKEIWKQYDGQKVKWSGKVVSIGDILGDLTMSVKMKPLTLISDVIVTLKASERENALKYKAGDAVTFVGILADWGTVLDYRLKNGEIVPN